MKKLTDEFENFKGFMLTLLGQKQFVSMFKKPDRSSILNFIVEHKYYDKNKTKELIKMYTETEYSGLIATLAKGEILKTIASKKDEVIKSLEKASDEELAFNVMLYNLEFFDDKKLIEIKTAVNEHARKRNIQ